MPMKIAPDHRAEDVADGQQYCCARAPVAIKADVASAVKADSESVELHGQGFFYKFLLLKTRRTYDQWNRAPVRCRLSLYFLRNTPHCRKWAAPVLWRMPTF
jgi:hypothetical protein